MVFEVLKKGFGIWGSAGKRVAATAWSKMHGLALVPRPVLLFVVYLSGLFHGYGLEGYYRCNMYLLNER